MPAWAEPSVRLQPHGPVCLAVRGRVMDDERERYPCGKLKQDRVSASQSFKAGEVKVLSSILDALLRGGDARQAARHEAFAGLARKTSAMKRRIEEKRQIGVQGNATDPE